MLNLPLLLTQLLVILASARIAGRAARALGQPSVVGEMFAGIALGPSLLGVVAPAALGRLFPPDALVPMNTLSQLGVILFMFVVGLRLHLAVLRGRLRSAVVISQVSIILPFALGSMLGWWIYPTVAEPHVARVPFVLFVGAAMSITAFPVLARILAERNLTTTRLGSIATACAAVDDATAWCLLAAVVAVARSGNALQQFGQTLGGAALYTLVVATLGHRLWERWNSRSSAAVGPELVGAAVLLALRYGPAALLPALPALALTAPFFDDRPRVALLGVGVTAAIAVAAWGLRRDAWRPAAASAAVAAGESLASALPVEAPLVDLTGGDAAG